MPTVAELAVVIDADTKGFDAGVKHVESTTKGLGDSIASGIGMGAGFGIVTKGIELLGDAFMAAKGSIIDLNSTLEQSKIAFTTMLGGAEQAEDFLNELQKFAANTPFEFPDLVTASKRMLAFGFESKQVVPLLTAVGDAVAAVGGGADVIDGVTTALGQMQAKGKVSAEEMGQLAERGIPAWDMLAKKMGVSIPEAMDAVSKGAVKAGTFIEAFQEGVSERFGGMMEKQSLTFAGAMSTISDSLQMALARGFKPLFDAVSAGAVALSKFVQSDAFNAWADRVAAAIASVASGLSALGTTLLPKIVDAWNTVLQVFNRDWSPSASIDPMVNALGMLATFLRDVVLPAVAEVTGFITREFGVVVAWFDENLPLIVEVVSLVLAEIGRFWDEHGKAIMAVVGFIWKTITTIIDLALKDILNIIKLAMQVLTGDYRGAWDTIKTMVSDHWEAEKTILSAAWVAIFAILDDATNGAMTRLATFMTDVGTAMHNGWDAVRTDTEAAWNGAAGIVATVAKAWDAITLGTGNAFNLPAGIIATTSSGWEAVIRATVSALTEGGSSLIGVVTKAWDDVVAFLKGLAGAGSALASAAGEIGRSIVAGLQEGISGALGGLQAWITENLTNALPEWVRSALGIKSPSTVFAEIGAQVVAGLISGLKGKQDALIKAATDMATKLVGTFDSVGDMGGVEEVLKAALAYTGHPESWMDGLKWIVHHESGGKADAKNPESTASGLFQLIDTTWAAYRDKSLPNDVFNPFANAVAGIRYIDQRYDSPNDAIRFWKANNWYGDGGIVGLHGPEIVGVGERGPEAIQPLSRPGGPLPMQSLRIDVAVGGRMAEEIYVTGRDLAIRRGRVAAGIA